MGSGAPASDYWRAGQPSDQVRPIGFRARISAVLIEDGNPTGLLLLQQLPCDGRARVLLDGLCMRPGMLVDLLVQRFVTSVDIEFCPPA